MTDYREDRKNTQLMMEQIKDASTDGGMGDLVVNIYPGDPDDPKSVNVHYLLGDYAVGKESLDSDRLILEYLAPERHQHISVPCSQNAFLTKPPLHKHSFTEILFVLNGIVYQRIEDDSFVYTAGQGCILNKNVAHTEEFIGDYTAMFLMLPDKEMKRLIRRDSSGSSSPPFSREMLQFLLCGDSHSGQTDKSYLDLSPAVPFDSFSKEIERLLDQILCEMTDKKPGYCAIADGLLLRLLSVLDDETLLTKHVREKQEKTQENTFTRLTDYMIDRAGRFSRQELETSLNYSANYLNKLCKQFSGKSLMEYGQFFSMKEAEKLLVTTDLSVDEIVARLGYANRSYFYRVFASQFHITPSKYRENNRR